MKKIEKKMKEKEEKVKLRNCWYKLKKKENKRKEKGALKETRDRR